MKQGRLKIYYGPMYSGKSAYIIKDILKHIDSSKLVFKPKGDERSDKLYTREGLVFNAISIEEPKEIIEHIHAWVRMVYVDEINFFGMEIVEVVEELINRGIDVVVSGLDKDFRMEWFEPSKALIEKADIGVRLMARCHICGKGSRNTARFVNGEPASIDAPIIVSDSSSEDIEYKTVCDEHHPFAKSKG